MRLQVWPAHNLVCGPGKANPFLWPRLTSREAEEAVKHKDVLFLGQASISMLIQVHGVARHEVDVRPRLSSVCEPVRLTPARPRQDKIRSISDQAPPCSGRISPSSNT